MTPADENVRMNLANENVKCTDQTNENQKHMVIDNHEYILMIASFLILCILDNGFDERKLFYQNIYVEDKNHNYNYTVIMKTPICLPYYRTRREIGEEDGRFRSKIE